MNKKDYPFILDVCHYPWNGDAHSFDMIGNYTFYCELSLEDCKKIRAALPDCEICTVKETTSFPTYVIIFPSDYEFDKEKINFILRIVGFQIRSGIDSYEKINPEFLGKRRIK